ncbi:MAG: glycoside hydrolase family 99-like domain-containing protein [Armatimonadota bacterium]|nr:glycoside hydrolase family 99-like domain-containing protein [Armatimonadota bacterium]
MRVKALRIPDLLTNNCILPCAISTVIALLAATAAGAPAPGRDKEVLVGVYYFAGWWKEQPNNYNVNGRDWRKDYPQRASLLGQYNDQETMDREIEAAAAHGVDFFQILWYHQDPKLPAEPHHEKLNEGIRLFMNSSENRAMKFTLEFVNHPPFAITSDAEWESACRYWVRVMKHPSYLRVGGRPVFKIHGLWHFLRQNGDDPEKVRKRIESFRRIAAKAGLPNPLISAGVGIGDVQKGPRAQPYDFLTTYMDMPNLPVKAEPYPYSALIDQAEKGWLLNAAESGKPYVPHVPAGWDPRPWGDPRPSFTFPTRDEWLDALRRVRSALESSDKLGAPSGKRKPRKMLLIYAWNEFGEGGILAPTQGERYMKLEAIKDVFGRR